MKELFCSYEQSLALKELGFDEPCLGFYERNKELIIQQCEVTDFSTASLQCIAPTKSQIFKWFRDKHDFSHQISKTRGGQYMPYVNGDTLLDVATEHKVGKILIDDKGYKWMYDTYEEAEDACIDKLIELIQLYGIWSH